MQDKLRIYIENIFESAPKTKKSVELKEEILQNMMEKYQDLLNEGKTEEAAYNIAVASIGDVGELIESLKKEAGGNGEEDMEKIKMKAMLTSGAVMLYILCVVPVIIIQNTAGVVLMFMMIACATGMLIYNDMVYKKYKKHDDTVVDNFKQWSTESEQKFQLRKAILSALWAVTVALYFLISFATMHWEVTWIIFLISGAVSKIIKAVFEFK